MKLKAVYGLSELAEMADMSRHQVYRLLIKKKNMLDVDERRPREKFHVALTSFRDAYPEIWDSILLRLSYETSLPGVD